MSSVASNAPDERQKALLQASARGQEARVRNLLSDSIWQSRMDTVVLRHSLQKVAARRGNVTLNLSLAQLLLEKGADIDPELNEVGALIKASESGNAPLVELLLRSSITSGKTIDINARDKNGRSAIFSGAWNGSTEVVQLLIAANADVDARDKEGRTPLVHLAAEKSGQWKNSMVELLLSKGANIEAVDNTKRTALLWAAATNKVELSRLLLSGSKARPANLRAMNNRGKTALQMAAEQGYAGIVKALLEAGADPTLNSDGQWTALHNAAEKGHIDVVKLLLDSSHADVNAETSSGMTALHWAAQNGHKDIVEVITQKADVILNGRDAFMSTPLLRAAERGHSDIVHMLSPYKMWDRLPHAAQQACSRMDATVVDFGVAPSEKNVEHRKGQLVNREQKIHELLYGWDAKNEKPTVSCLAKNIKSKPAFRWIHLPANNLDWVQTLLTKAFIEGGARDVDDFKALEKCFTQEHRGPTVHAQFMRTYCGRMGTSAADRQNPRLSPANAQGPFASPSPAAVAAVEKLQTEGSSSEHGNGTPRRSSAAQKDVPSKNQMRKAKRQMGQNKGKQQQSQDPNLSASISTIHSKKDSYRPPSTPKPDPRFGDKHGKVVFFIPYLHYETDNSRRDMSSVIRSVDKQDFQRFVSHYQTADENLIEGYLTASPQLHIRRTLDQFFYHGIDTKDRDEDQVVYRYCERLQKLGIKTEKKVFMVDQLWCFILSSELIVTCFPQRWHQPKNDPLNVLDGVIEDINSKTRPPVTSVYDLAMLISSRCSSVFDHNRLGHEEYQFLDMFDTSIGVVTNRETKLFRRFNAASAAAARWLKLHRRARSSEDKIADPVFEDKTHKHNTSFVDELLNIDTETELLAEIKDIRDELQMIDKVLKEQKHVIPDLADKMMEELGGRRTSAALDIQRKSKEQLKLIDTHIKDVDRMDMQAEGIYTSLTHLLDLKQKHANAFEARFARDQAELQAKQGQTIMVFTIVTIVFLPLSFMAAFFTINIEQFPKAAGGNNQLNLHWVSKYLFGIGLAISIPLIALAFSVHDIVEFFRRVRRGTVLSFHRPRKPKINVAVSPPEGDEYPTGRISRNSHRRRRSDAYASVTSDYEKVNGRVNHLSPGRKSLGVENRERALDLSPERDFPPPTRQWSRRTEFSWRLDVRGRNSRDTDRLGFVV